MSISDVERIDDQGMAAWDQHNVDDFVALFASDFVFRDVSVPEVFTTPEGVRRYMEAWYKAFPDMRAKTTNRVVSENQVAGEVQFTATHSGPLNFGGTEIPATGKSVVGGGSYFAKVEDGKIVSFTAYPDAAGLMAQLGLMGAQA